MNGANASGGQSLSPAQLQQLYAARGGGSQAGFSQQMYQQQPQQQGGGPMNPVAALMRFQAMQQQQRQGGQGGMSGVNPAQLMQSMNGSMGMGGGMNGMNNMSMPGGLNPSAFMNAGGGSGGGSMNPSAMMNMNMMGNGSGGGGGGMGNIGVNPAAMMGFMNGSAGGGGGMGVGNMGGMVSMNGMSNMGMGGMGSGGGMGMGNMGAMGGINPAALMGGASSPTNPSLNLSGVSNATSPTAPQMSPSMSAPMPSSTPNPMTNVGSNHNLAAQMHSSGMNMGMGSGQGLGMNPSATLNPAQMQQSHSSGGGGGGMHALQSLGLSNAQIAQLSQMPQQERERYVQQIRMMQMQRATMMRERETQLQGAGMNNAGAGGMQGINPAQMQQQQAHERFQQLSSGAYERPSSAASTGSHSQRIAQAQGQGQGHPGQQGFQRPQTPNLSTSQSSMMPPPTTIPPRPGTANSQRPQPSGSYGALGVPSPRLNTSGGGSAATPSPRVPSGSLPGTTTPGPVPIQPRPTAGSPAPSMTRPGTSMSMSSINMATMVHGQDTGSSQQQKAPSRPATAAGFAQHPQIQQQAPNIGLLGVNTSIAGSQVQSVKSPGGFTPIAPAPSHPGSPSRGSKRKAGGTPAPGQQSHSQPQTPHDQQHQQRQQGTPGPQQIPRLPMPPIPSSAVGSNGAASPSGLSGGANQQGQQAAGNLSAASGLLGGAGGGMMGPPVWPRSSSQNQIHQAGGDIGINPAVAMGMNGTPSMARHLSSGNVALNTTFPGALPNVSTPGSSSMGQPSPVVDPRSMGALPNGVGLGLGTPALSGMSGISGMDVPVSVPQTPIHQNSARQRSQPPVSSPFPASPTVSGSMTALMGSQPGMSERKPAADGQPVENASPVKVNGAPQTSTPTVSIVPIVPPLPTNVQFNANVTRATIVPLAESVARIPPLTAEEIADVKHWMKVDKEYEAKYAAMRQRMEKEIEEIVRKPKAWWERDAVVDDGRERLKRRPEKFGLNGLKNQKERDARDRKRAGKREGFKLPRRLTPEDANRTEQLVPIRLEFDVDHNKMRDTFVWNLNDPVITPEIFAQSVVDDYGLTSSYHAVITKAIQDQLSDFKAHSTTFGEDGVSIVEDGDDVQRGILDEKEAEWWESWRKKVRSEAAFKRVGPRPDGRLRKKRKVVKEEGPENVALPGGAEAKPEAPMTVDDFEEDENSMQEEMRILVKLDIIVGPVKLEDQFEWNLENNDPSPELFAEIYTRDLGLGGEFKTAIAHSIREQVQIYQKSLFLVGHPSDGSAVQDDDLRMSLLPSLTSGARSMDQVSAFTPILNYLSDSEIERNEKEREKELNRRRRKTTRGRRGIALPDREPPKTFRTPAIGFPEIDALTLAAINAAAIPTSKRAAAAAASLTIANMVASENGTVVLPTAQPAPLVPVIPAVPKEKKPKGLFKAPSYPASVLRPRAQVRGPTSSTAADPSTLPPPLEDDLPISSSSGAPDSRGARVVLPAKRAKELEREAKEKEFVDGQHANIIDGVWHCSNCGCPENIAVGRRKGPLGDKSQCGTCGKFWHRHRRPRPVEYNPSAEYHLNLLKEAEQAKVAAKKRRPAAAAANDDRSSRPVVDEGEAEPDTPSRPTASVWVDVPSQPSRLSNDTNRAASPISTSSSASESPLAARRVNGNTHSRSAPPAAADTGDEQGTSQAAPPAASPLPARPSVPPNLHQPTPTPIPDWLTHAMNDMQARYPEDRIEVTLRKTATSPTTPGNLEWRIKCLDCPGKLYTPGPGETLQNYEVHLKNRQHRQRVNARLGNGSA